MTTRTNRKMTLTYKYRLLPSRRQREVLARVLDDQRILYNAALEERIGAYRRAGISISYIDQCKSLTECRRALPEMAATPLNIQRGTIKRLDKAFKGFFSRVKRSAKPGFPRFRGKERFNSFDFNEMDGLRYDGNRLRWSGMPSGLRVHLHRPMPEGKILTAKFKRDHKGWSVCFAIRSETPEKRIVSSAVGIDVGIKTLAATSDGLLIQNPRAARRSERAMRRTQRALARCKRGSTSRRKARQRLARLHAKIANTRATALHQISAMLAKRYDVIAVEALNTKGLARGILARDVHDASWSKLRDLLRYKAERAGAHFIEVNPKFTSQDCPDCGRRQAKTLAERVHSCPCGCVLDRDVAAARVILSRAVVGPGRLNVAGCSVRAAGNLKQRLI
jgi:putative transposase